LTREQIREKHRSAGLAEDGRRGRRSGTRSVRGRQTERARGKGKKEDRKFGNAGRRKTEAQKVGGIHVSTPV
jgi:hypothetical protein